MGLAAQLVTGRVTNPGATITAVTPNTGDSFAVANFTPSSNAYLEQIWAREGTPGVLRIRSPRLHDQSQGIRVQVGDTVPRLLLPTGTSQHLYPSDVLTVELSGGAAEVDMVALLFTFDDLPGTDARLAHWSEVQPRVRNIAGVEVDATTSATAGDWSAGRAINADFNTVKAQTDYAILGYTVATAVGAVAVAGFATGNLKLGGPGALDHLDTREYFADLSTVSGRPYIPIVNGSDAGSTLLFVADPAVSTAIHVSLTLAELAT